MKFSELQLHPLLQANLDRINFTECTQIQDQAIPVIRRGKDVAGLAQTGTGKTAAFLIPIIDRILKGIKPDPALNDTPTDPFPEWKTKQYILVLVPTRELADQVQENAQKLLQDTGLKSVSIYGGTTYEKQIGALKAGVEFVIATPGRLIDLYKEHVCDLGLVRAVVFDEADRMFDMGFKDDMKFILRRLPRDRQFCVFSATLNFDVLNVAYEFGADPTEVNISRDQAKAENVKDFMLHVGQDDKPKYLLSLLKKYNPRQAIIFSNFKHNVERLERFLNSNNIPAVGISSLLTQGQRNRVMEQFKGDNDRNIMVATDVAARGLDILGVDMVLNYDLPDDPENYVHRIGRTGRAGATGQAFSMVSDRDVDALQRVEEYLKHKIEVLWLDDPEIIEEYQPMAREERGFRGPPRDRPRSGGPGGGGGGGPRGERGPRREGGGGRDRGPRREGGGGGRDRGPRNDRDRDQQRARPQGEGGGGGGGQHRDRQSGRHRQDQQGNGQPRRHGQGGGRDQQQRHGGGGGGGQRHQQGRGGQRDQQQRRHGGGQGQRPQGGGGPMHRRPLPGRPPTHVQAKKSQGIGQKVSGFFKKLFGGKES